jgi:acylglycerol lipase
MFTDFAKEGIKVLSFDQRGFGHTVRFNGKHGSSSVSSTLGDINLLSQSLQVPMIPHFVMGHSMGGALALLYSHHHPKGLAGVISCSPAIRPGKTSKPNFALNFLLNTLFVRHLRSVVIDSSLDVNNICRDAENRRQYVQDPLIHSWVSVGLGI